MSYREIIQTLVQYHVNSNLRLWDQIKHSLTDDQFTQQLGYSHGSLRHQVVHLAATDRYWLHDLQSKTVVGLDPEDYPTRESVSIVWEEIEQDLLRYAQSLTDADLQDKPDGFMVTRWQGLLHVVNHGTDHRAQILSMLHMVEAPTFEQDFADYLRINNRVSKADVLRLISYWRGQWIKARDAIPREQMAQPLIDGWSIKDMMAHLTWYDREIAKVLKERPRDRTGWWNLSRDERNQHIFQHHQPQPLEEVFREHEESFSALINEIEKLGDEDLNASALIWQMPPVTKLWMMLEENTWFHYMMHTEALWEVM